MFKRILLVIVFFSVIVSVKADEGMWMLNKLKMLNEADMQSKGLKLSADEIYSINSSSMKDAIVHFGGFCTGEIVSADGLILTNHHCGLDAVQSMSTPENDFMTKGFWATSKELEKPCEGLFVKFLVRIEDVTEKVKGQLSDTMSEATMQQKLPGIFAKITGEANEEKKYSSDVRSFFGGNEYYLLVYETYKDVRLVGNPPIAMGNFGGDTDNWMWPRHTCDFSMFRVYATSDGKPAAYSKDNVPYKSKHFLPVNIKGVNEGDFAMTLGYPGRTDRYATSFAVQYALDITSPAIVKLREKRLEIWDDAMSNSNEVRIKYQAKKNNISNYWKYFIGQMKQLNRMKVTDQKRELETQFQQWANGDANRKAEYGSVLNDLQNTYANFRKYGLARQYLQECAFAPEILTYANSFNQLGETLKNKEAKPDDIAAKTATLKENITDFYKEYDAQADQRILAAMLKMYYEDVPKEQHAPIFAEIMSKYKGDFEKYAEEVFEASMFASKVKVEAFLAKPSSKKLEKDMAYKTITSIFNNYTTNYRPTVRTYEQSIAASNRKFIRGLRLMLPDKKFSPDANSTMRLSYGSVKTYDPADAVKYNWFTTINGIMEKMDNSNPDFVVPAKQVELYNKKDFGRYGQDGTLRTCFLTTNDITGGNSGSPVINGNGELIGLAFDGNWEAMSGDIKFDPDYKRTINVDIRYVLWVIEKMMGGVNTVNEMKIVE
jgi:Peptidase S46